MLKRKGVVSEWNDRRILPGQEWDKQIDQHLESADIILLLVSPDFVASDYCYDIEVARAMQRHEAGEARVVPVILRFTDDWQSAPFGKLQALPKDAQPVKDWPDRDKAFADVAAGIRRAVEDLLSSREGQVENHDKPEKTPSPSLIPRPPVIGFVARRDAQGHDIVGRLREELAPERSQLVTLSGPGGIGKTTLAAEAARALQEAYRGRATWSSADGRADFSLLSLLDDIATQLGRAELRTLAPVEKEEQVRALVADALVVLDNYETVAEAERKSIEAWFKRTRCSALFTSRLPVDETKLVRVSAMSRKEAEEFLERLTAEQTMEPQVFTPDVRRRVYETAEANPHVMQWVVGRIDLAQEPGAVLEELQHGEGDAAERIFDRSFELPLLGEDGRDALLALSLFAPGATPDALAAVAGFDDAGRVREAVGNLRRLWLVKGVDGNRRLAVEGLTRTLAVARLSKDPRGDEFRRRFVAYFLRYAVVREEPAPENYDALEAERENLLSAAEAAYTYGDWESVMLMAFALAQPVDGMLSVRGYWDEAVRLGEQAFKAAHVAKGEVNIAIFSYNVAVMYENRGELAEARRLFEESLEIDKRLDNQSGVAVSLHQLGMLALDAGETEEARRLYGESLEIDKRLGDQSGVASSLHELAVLAQNRGEFEEARRLHNESLEIRKRLGDQSRVASTLHQLGKLAWQQGELNEARRLYDEGLEIKKRLGDQVGVAYSLHNLAVLAVERGEREEARRLYDGSLEITKRLGDQSGVASTLHELGRLAEDEGDKEGAARLFRESLSIFERLGSPNAEIARESLARVEGESS
jgi:tetratricopeptide (TPR) repeat protein